MHAFAKRFSQIEIVVCEIGSHLQVHPAKNRAARVVNASPIRHDQSLKTPFALQNLIQQIITLAAVDAAQLVVCAHHRPHFRLLHRRLERGQMDFAQRPFIHLHVHFVAISLLIVRGKMFGARRDALRLNARDVTHRHATSEERIFAEVFKIPPTQRRAHDVHARPKHDVLAALARLLPDHHAFVLREFRIPRRRQRDAARHGRGKIIRAPRHRPGVRPDIFAHAMRTIRKPAPRNAETRNRRRGEF